MQLTFHAIMRESKDPGWFQLDFNEFEEIMIILLPDIQSDIRLRQVLY